MWSLRRGQQRAEAVEPGWRPHETRLGFDRSGLCEVRRFPGQQRPKPRQAAQTASVCRLVPPGVAPLQEAPAAAAASCALGAALWLVGMLTPRRGSRRAGFLCVLPGGASRALVEATDGPEEGACSIQMDQVLSDVARGNTPPHNYNE